MYSTKKLLLLILSLIAWQDALARRQKTKRTRTVGGLRANQRHLQDEDGDDEEGPDLFNCFANNVETDVIRLFLDPIWAWGECSATWVESLADPAEMIPTLITCIADSIGCDEQDEENDGEDGGEKGEQAETEEESQFAAQVGCLGNWLADPNTVDITFPNRLDCFDAENGGLLVGDILTCLSQAVECTGNEGEEGNDPDDNQIVPLPSGGGGLLSDLWAALGGAP